MVTRVYWTGEDPNEYRSPAGFTRYAHRLLGVEMPVYKGRGIWHAKLMEEKEANGWVWDDLAKTVRYLKAHNKHVGSVFGILYYVDKAKAWSEYLDEYDLQAKVAEAMSEEEDETWRRRLSLAKGKALSRVYEQWRIQRAV